MGDINGLPPSLGSIMISVSSNLIGTELVPVRPMKAPSAALHYMDFPYHRNTSQNLYKSTYERAN